MIWGARIWTRSDLWQELAAILQRTVRVYQHDDNFTIERIQSDAAYAMCRVLHKHFASKIDLRHNIQ